MDGCTFRGSGTGGSPFAENQILITSVRRLSTRELQLTLTRPLWAGRLLSLPISGEAFAGEASVLACPPMQVWFDWTDKDNVKVASAATTRSAST
jgi:hypothetical protein